MEPLNSQLIEMIRDRFDAVDAKLDRAATAFDAHAKQDEKYWKLLDAQQAQLSLIKRVFWGLVTIGGTIGGWLGWHR